MPSPAYLQRVKVHKIGLENVDVRPVQLLLDFFLGGGLITNKPDNGVGRVCRDLAEKFKLEESISILSGVNISFLMPCTYADSSRYASDEIRSHGESLRVGF